MLLCLLLLCLLMLWLTVFDGVVHVVVVVVSMLMGWFGMLL